MAHSWMGIVLAVIGLGVIVLVHEWGHFVVARFFGVRVDVFSIGYGNRIFGWKRGDTDYRISVFPFGGYVRMAGENPAEERTGAPNEFLGKPRWQRLFIILAGPFMNGVLAFVLLWALFIVGMPIASYMHSPVQVAGVLADSPAAKAGLLPGDRIVEINGKQVSNWEQAGSDSVIVPGHDVHLKVDRDGSIVPLKVTVPQDLRDGFGVLGYPQARITVDEVSPGLPAAKAGLKPGDVIVSLDGAPAVDFEFMVDYLQKAGGKPISIVAERGGQQIPMTMKLIYGDPDGAGKRWVVGFTRVLDSVHESYPVMGAAQQSWVQSAVFIKELTIVLGGLVTGRVSIKQLAGPVGIVRMSTEAARLGMPEFILFMAFLSVNLGFLNLLPIPILDGGHVLMLAIEGTLRRDLSLAVKERFVQVGLVFLLVLIGFVTYYDIVLRVLNR